MEQELILGVLIGILVLVSAFQAFQLAELNGRVQAMGAAGLLSTSLAPASGGQAQAAGQVQLPSGLANAPEMVGGC
ncbi:TPA: hypothetical protein HA244_01405 [Candidatus Micrarchaeota archaeon]|nr:hypothetical protein [Candidatus Micrarchaeota archaeon]